MKTKIISIFTLFLLVISCDSNSDVVSAENEVLINKKVYDTIESNHFTIKNVSISGDLLKVTISSGGCDGSSWVANLIDSGKIAESLPVQRYAKIQLKNKEACLAYLTKEFTFNIYDLKVGEETILHLDGWDEKITLKQNHPIAVGVYNLTVEATDNKKLTSYQVTVK